MKNLFIFLFNFILFSTNLAIADTTDQDAINKVYKSSEKVLNQLRRNNNFSKDYRIIVQNTTDTLPTFHKNGTIYVPTALLNTCETEDLYAANLAIVIGIAESQNSTGDKFKRFGAASIGFIPTILIWPYECPISNNLYNSWSEGNYIVGDILAIEYLINAKYNPLALEVAISRFSDSTPGALRNKKVTGKQRQIYIHNYISKNYPEFLTGKATDYYKNLTYLYCFENTDNCKNATIPTKYIDKKNKILNKQRKE